MSITLSNKPIAQGSGQAAPDSTVESVHPATRFTGLLIVAAVLILSILASLAVGAKSLNPETVLSALRGTGDPETLVIVNELRVPRTFVGLLTGASLAVAGALIQALTRNPLADPGILGVNAGAGFAVVIAVAVFSLTDIRDYIWFSFAGAILATLVVYVIGSRGRGGATPVRLTLAGVALGAILGGISNGVTLLNPEAFDRMRYWGAGSLNNRTLDMAASIAPFVILGLLFAFFSARSLNAISLGDDMAQALGARVLRTRIFVIIAVTLLCGAATAAAGPIGFIGLMIPHVARWIVGPHQLWILLYSLMMGPALLLFSDVLGRVVIPPGELQVGIVTAFVGAPVLIWLVRRRKASEL